MREQDAHGLAPADVAKTWVLSPLMGLLSAGQLGQPPRDLSVPVGRRMLVAHCGARGGVTKAAHELGQCRAGLCGKDGAGVAEVVPAEVLPAGGLACGVEDL